MLGIVTSLLLSIIANFRVSEFPEFHFLSAHLLLIISMITLILYTRLSFLTPHVTAHKMAKIRLIMVTFIIILGISLITTTILVLPKLKNMTTERRLKWKPEDDGYLENAIGSMLEWLWVFLTSIYIGTFHYELKNFG